MNAIEVNELRKNYGNYEALKGVSFKVKKGEIYGFLGPNGAGKSTTINILSGLLTPDSGEVKILGKPVSEVKYDLNVVTAYQWMIGILTVKQNLRVFSRLFNVKNSEKKINYLLEQFKLKHLERKKAYGLSSGENTRLNLCKGLINDPKVLLLDECTVGLDPDIALHTREIIRGINKDRKTTILFTSHIMNEVEELCKRGAFISQGKILKVGTVHELKKMVKKQTVVMDFFEPKKSVKAFFQRRKIPLINCTKDHVVFELENADNKLHDVVHPLFKEGFKIRDMEIKKPSLEDLFIDVARGKL